VEPCGAHCLERACSAITVFEKLDVSDLVSFETRQKGKRRCDFLCGHADNGKCKMDSGDYTTFYQDFVQVPSADAYGDQLTGGSTYLSNTSLVFSGNSPLNQPADEQQFRNLSSNAADGAATRLRTDSKLRITIYTIALAGNSGGNIYDLLDATLLQRIANATSSPVYSPSQPVGAYFYAQDATYLGAEFSAVASEISARLSH
jgi:hypothetical protein